ncbi:hypothetical protein NAT51_15375 [Flavobacterium amniphilum]|uniref:hypothetical protein n=1 Tax=Flavobacterium amniphilum TaxID=1834035 RepID=UPI00202AAF67|nr:hypothetical protein [Flavobacterium amniphilum]MCL9806916.1 hypothetical protein [Flavobacterium amniphilum]
MNKKTDKIVACLLVIIVLMFVKEKDYCKVEVGEKEKVTIGKYVARERWGKHPPNYFSYYINGTKYRANGGTGPQGFYYSNLNKFFKIVYSEDQPEGVRPMYYEEVTDTAELLKAGFSMNEILNKQEIDLFP